MERSMLKQLWKFTVIACLALSLAGCSDIVEGLIYDDYLDSNNEDLFNYLVLTGAPSLSVSTLYDEYLSDLSLADQAYSGKYAIIWGAVYDQDREENPIINGLLGDLTWALDRDTEVILTEGGKAIACFFNDYLKPLEELAAGDVVCIVGLTMRDGSSLYLDRCEYIKVY